MSDNPESSVFIFSFFVFFYSFSFPQMEQGLVELKNIFIKNVNKIIEEAKNNNEIESALKSVCLP